MWAKAVVGAVVLAVIGAAAWLVVGRGGTDGDSVELLNVSYDPTR